MSAPIVCCSDVWFSFGESDVLRGISVAAEPGEMVAIVGTSGSGKTTLLRVLAGIEVPRSGSVTFEDVDLTASTERDRAAMRLARMGFVLQFARLVPELTLTENVALPLELLGVRPRDARERAAAALGRLGLDRSVAARTAARVSGGQVQRAAVARAIITDPAVVFADEPTGALDSENSEGVLRALEAARSPGRALVVVTHDEKVAARADRVVRVSDGTVVG